MKAAPYTAAAMLCRCRQSLREMPVPSKFAHAWTEEHHNLTKGVSIEKV